MPSPGVNAKTAGSGASKLTCVNATLERGLGRAARGDRRGERDAVLAVDREPDARRRGCRRCAASRISSYTSRPATRASVPTVTSVRLVQRAQRIVEHLVGRRESCFRVSSECATRRLQLLERRHRAAGEPCGRLRLAVDVPDLVGLAVDVDVALRRAGRAPADGRARRRGRRSPCACPSRARSGRRCRPGSARRPPRSASRRPPPARRGREAPARTSARSCRSARRPRSRRRTGAAPRRSCREGRRHRWRPSARGSRPAATSGTPIAAVHARRGGARHGGRGSCGQATPVAASRLGSQRRLRMPGQRSAPTLARARRMRVPRPPSISADERIGCRFVRRHPCHFERILARLAGAGHGHDERERHGMLPVVVERARRPASGSTRPR